MLILQITTPQEVTQQVAETAPPPDITLLEMLSKGGFFMIPLGLLFILLTYLVVERFLYLRTVIKQKDDIIPTVRKHLQDGDLKMVRLYTEQQKSALARVLGSGLDFIGRPFKEIESVMETAINIEVAQMEKNLGYIGIIAGVAPMLGFLGTISGIIHIFYSISLSDNISIGIIAGGLYEKMITSGTGLAVGVLAYIAYHLLNQKIQHFSIQVQKDVLKFMQYITSPA